jgi:WD40 repeat protein
MPTSQCPVTHQYLAVGCSRSSLISKHFYDEIYSYKNYIQIWMFDLSNIKTNLSPQNHQLICLIPINDSGAIWSLKWSPSSSSPSAYLAAGTSSGSVYLYKLFSQRLITPNKNLSFYKSSKLIRFLLNEPNNQTQCLAIDWSIHDPNRITACYSNGFIALFHVNTKAKHLIELVNRKCKDISRLIYLCFRNPIKKK